MQFLCAPSLQAYFVYMILALQYPTVSTCTSALQYTTMFQRLAEFILYKKQPKVYTKPEIESILAGIVVEKWPLTMYNTYDCLVCSRPFPTVQVPTAQLPIGHPPPHSAAHTIHISSHQPPLPSHCPSPFLLHRLLLLPIQ